MGKCGWELMLPIRIQVTANLLFLYRSYLEGHERGFLLRVLKLITANKDFFKHFDWLLKFFNES